jgi:superfamily II DNA or RNA helicase
MTSMPGTAMSSWPITSGTRLLFIAHREELLSQSLQTFRAVLRDTNFGDLLVGGHEPESLDYLFVSIQSYNSRALVDLPADRYE